jgi:RNA polymerase sigma factor for flagellar operon FliA
MASAPRLPPGTTPVPRDSRVEDEVLSRFKSELDLVEINAHQVARRIGPGSVTLDDLRSFGQEGLLQASRSFDATRGVPFRRWANLRIRGAMMDGVRQWGALPRRVYRELRAIAAADRLQETYDEESAGTALHASPAGGPPGSAAESADARLTAHLAGLATAMSMSMLGGGAQEPVDDGPSPEERLLRAEAVARIKEIASRLPDAERTLVERHYFGDETLDQAAASLGLSKSWGSRLHARAIDAITRELKRQG